MELFILKGFYIGFKATVVMDYDSMNPVCILIHSGAPNDAKLFDEIMENLQKRRIIQKGDILIFDKGYVRQEASLFSI